MSQRLNPDQCTACGVDDDRREFLRQVAAAAVGIFVGLGAARRDAIAMPIARIAAAGSRIGGKVSYPIPAADGATIDTDNEIIIARYHGAVYAFDLSCPHQRTMLRWLSEEGRFQCPKHKSKYQPDGVFISGRATRNMDRHPIALDQGKIVVDVELILQSDKDGAAWAAAMVKP